MVDFFRIVTQLLIMTNFTTVSYARVESKAEAQEKGEAEEEVEAQNLNKNELPSPVSAAWLCLIMSSWTLETTFRIYN